MKFIILLSSENDAASTTALTAVMKRGLYVKFSQQVKVSVAKYASEHGVAAALRHYITKFQSSRKVLLEHGEMFMLHCNESRRFKMTCVQRMPEKRENALFCWAIIRKASIDLRILGIYERGEQL